MPLINDGSDYYISTADIDQQVAVGRGSAYIINQTIDSYTIFLFGASEDSPAYLYAYNSDLGHGLITDVADLAVTDFAHISLIGTNTFEGWMDFATGNTMYPVLGDDRVSHINIKIVDIASDAGRIVSPGLFINTGNIDIEPLSEATIQGTSKYSILENDGVIDEASSLIIGVAVTGTGLIHAAYREFTPQIQLEFGASVSSGQMVDVWGTRIVLDDPGDFKATIRNFETVPTYDYVNGPYTPSQNEVVLRSIHATAATFGGGLLTLLNGSQTVAQLKFSGQLVASHFLVANVGGDVRVTYAQAPASSTVPVTTSPVIPTLQILPSSSRQDVILTDGTYVASNTAVDGYTLKIEGVSAATMPAVNVTQVGLAGKLKIIAGGDAAAAMRFGQINAVGFNENDGLIDAKPNGGGAATTLAVNVSSITAPSGITISPGVFNNRGAIEAEAGATVSITGSAGSKLVNTGSITAFGSAFLGINVTDTGQMTVGAHGGSPGRLEIGNAISTGQTIYLEQGALVVDDVRDFFATIRDFGVGDVISLPGTVVNSVTYTNGKLALHGDSGDVGALHFMRAAGTTLSTSNFVLSHSTQGSTDIHFS